MMIIIVSLLPIVFIFLFYRITEYSINIMLLLLMIIIIERCAKNSHVIDIFTCSLDQIGLLEMNELSIKTGGVTVMGDSFGQTVFKESFRRMFERTESQEIASADEVSLFFQYII